MFRASRRLRRLRHRRHLQRGERGPGRTSRARHRGRPRRRRPVRHAGRHRDRRRPAHRAVAERTGRRRRPLVAAAHELWDDPDVFLGGSDAGAHLDRMCGGSYPTQLLADTLRGRKLVSLEWAVHDADRTSRRSCWASRDRGSVVESARHADLVVFDPDDGRERARHARPRPARRRSCAWWPASVGRAARLRQRRRDGRRRRGHRRPSRAPCSGPAATPTPSPCTEIAQRRTGWRRWSTRLPWITTSGSSKRCCAATDPK